MKQKSFTTILVVWCVIILAQGVFGQPILLRFIPVPNRIFEMKGRFSSNSLFFTGWQPQFFSSRCKVYGEKRFGSYKDELGTHVSFWSSAESEASTGCAIVYNYWRNKQGVITKKDGDENFSPIVFPIHKISPGIKWVNRFSFSEYGHKKHILRFLTFNGGSQENCHIGNLEIGWIAEPFYYFQITLGSITLSKSTGIIIEDDSFTGSFLAYYKTPCFFSLSCFRWVKNYHEKEK